MKSTMCGPSWGQSTCPRSFTKCGCSWSRRTGSPSESPPLPRRPRVSGVEAAAEQQEKKMMVIQYAALFRIECLHGYFGGARCRSLVLAPSEDCRALLERYRMLFRQSTGG